ncbi:CPBP family intramembrane glutamic endopeptidase [Winogradskyella sp.]|uniref:CPBP family intramembrane glutamic endopeptidase n=1 Tax=Winogradskyella sp. TaxID=1883156 RepID=UPI001B02C283|nr:CPBP family intramembrane glutamic endopeptidase [Winogradskyella sp.]MBO6880521.1 CPBP family intramembrane metalloprotease [Winogradskyella sp.]
MKIFTNTKDRRLKAGWRILFFLLIFFSFSSLIFIIKPIFDTTTKREFLENYSLIIVAILAFGATISTALSRKFWDKKSFVSLGLKCNKQGVKDVIFGFLLSGLMAAAFYFLLISLGLLDFNGFNLKETDLNQSFDFVQFMNVLTLGSLGLILVEHILVGYWEELVFRGYIFQNMIEGLGLIKAIVISCVIYGLIHYINPNATILSSAIIIGFGFLRIYGYLSTKMLWLSIGMHIGWNFFQGPIFGFAASGHKKATLLTHSFTSNKEYLTGGEFGPEGSVLIIPILISTILIMKWYSKNFHHKEIEVKAKDV